MAATGWLLSLDSCLPNDRLRHMQSVMPHAAKKTVTSDSSMRPGACSRPGSHSEDVGADHCCVQLPMTKHLLNRVDIGSCLQQVPSIVIA